MPVPNLGYGQRAEAPINAVNSWMRGQPWYQSLLASWGQTPTNVHLSDWQKQQLIRAAQANGVVVDEGHDGQQLDDAGNFQAKGHGLRNTLIVAGVAAAALATMGAAGVFAGGGAAAGGGASAAGGAAAAGSGAAAGGGAALAGGSAVAAGAASAVPWGTIVGAGTNLFGNLFAAHAQSASADRAAQIASDGAKYSADLTAKANADALRFQYANSENAFQNNEAARKGNYGLFAARERRLGSIGDEVGLGAREIPAYVPGVDPMFGGGPSGVSVPSNGVDSNVAAFIQQWQSDPAHPASEGIGPMAAAIAKQFPGVTRYMYGATPSNNELSVGGQKYKVLGGEGSPAAYWYQPGMNDASGGSAVPAATVARRYHPITTATPFMSPMLAAGVPQNLGYYA